MSRKSIKKEILFKIIKDYNSGLVITPRAKKILLENQCAIEQENGILNIPKNILREALKQPINKPTLKIINEKLYSLSQSDLRKNYIIEIVDFNDEKPLYTAFSSQQVFKFMYNYQSKFNDLLDKYWNIELDIRSDESPEIKQTVQNLIHQKCSQQFQIDIESILFLREIVKSIGLMKTNIKVDIDSNRFEKIIEQLNCFESKDVYTHQILYVKNAKENNNIQNYNL